MFEADTMKREADMTARSFSLFCLSQFIASSTKVHSADAESGESSFEKTAKVAAENRKGAEVDFTGEARGNGLRRIPRQK